MRSKKVLKNVITAIISQCLMMFGGLIIPRLILSNYGSAMNGLINSITQFLGYISLMEGGFGPIVKSALYKPIAQKDKEEIGKILFYSEKFFKRISLIFILYIIAMCIYYPTIVNSDFEFGFTIAMIIILSISTFSKYFFGITYMLFLNADQKNYVVNIIQIITYIIYACLTVILIKCGASILIVKLFTALIFIIRPLLQNYYVKKKYNIKLNKNKDFKLKQQWDGLAQHVAAVVKESTDVVVLTLFCGVLEVSVYVIYIGVIKNIRNFIISISQAFNSSFGNMIANNEKDNLKIKFRVFELIFHSVNTIVFSTTLIMMVPFIKIYTEGIKDVDYIRYAFSTTIIIAEYINVVRVPYMDITYAAGHFKGTRNGAIIEAVVNLGLSILLVFRFGIIGVAIGTLVAVLIRTFEFIIYSSRKILCISYRKTLIRLVIMGIEMSLIYLLCRMFDFNIIKNYFTWSFYSLCVVLISCIIVIGINILFDINAFKEMIKILKRRKKQEV